MYHAGVLALLLTGLLAATPVERVVAVVNGVPVLATDVELARVAGLVPPRPDEDAAAHASAVVDALVDLELRWQDLRAAAITDRLQVDDDALWRAVTERAGGDAALAERLAAAGLPPEALRFLLRRAAAVQAYVSERFAPFARPTESELESYWEERLVPELRAAGEPVPELEAVRDRVETLVSEEKLLAEVERWTAELARRAEVVRYRR